MWWEKCIGANFKGCDESFILNLYVYLLLKYTRNELVMIITGHYQRRSEDPLNSCH